jgi:hypothetical protein
MKVRATATIVMLLAAAGVALAAMIKGAGKFEWDVFYTWVIGPYVVLLLIFCLPLRQSDARSVAGCFAAGVVLTFSCFIYIGAKWVSASPTSAYIFMFAPPYLFVGGLAVWALTWALLRWRTTRRNGRE